jgi:hypothetical protein
MVMAVVEGGVIAQRQGLPAIGREEFEVERPGGERFHRIGEPGGQPGTGPDHHPGPGKPRGVRGAHLVVMHRDAGRQEKVRRAEIAHDLRDKAVHGDRIGHDAQALGPEREGGEGEGEGGGQARHGNLL